MLTFISFFFSHLLSIFWILIATFPKSLQDCFLEGESSEVDKVVTCNNITISDSLEKKYKISFKEIEEISFSKSSGHLNNSVLKNANSLKGLLIYRSSIGLFEPEVHTLKTMQIHHSNFDDDSNFDKCCNRLKRLLLSNTTGFVLEESVFKKLTRLKELKLSHQNVDYLSEAVFKGLESLEELRISDVNFKKIGNNTFAYLTELEELYIELPNIEELAQDIFKPLKKLKVLNIISTKRLKSLPLGMFSNLKNLRQLELPLSTWRDIDVEKIPVMFPKLYSYSRSGDYDSMEDKKYFAAKFNKLHEIIVNRNRR